MGFFNIHFDEFTKYFKHLGDTTNIKLFLHPLSHEIDFMNMNKVFRIRRISTTTLKAGMFLISLPCL